MSRIPLNSVAPKKSIEAGCRAIGAAIQGLVNPADLFSGVRVADALLADNIVVFKRTSAEMLKPHGVTHNYHHRFVLVLPLVKSGRIHIDGIPYTLAPGQTVLIFPHQFHHYLDIGEGPISWLFITFESVRAQPLLPLRNSPRALGRGEVDFLRQLVAEYRQPAPAADRSVGLIFNVSKLLLRLLDARKAECAVRQEAQGDDPRGSLLESINAYVRSHLDKSLTIADLAGHTGYSISYLRAVFRKQFGVSLGGYMRDSRLSMAAAMLADGERNSIENIAKACGFVSIFAFSRAFKNAMDVSPRAYRKFIKAGGDGAQARPRDQ